MLGYGASDPNKSADTAITDMLKERYLNGEFKLEEAVKHMVGMGLKPDEEKAYDAVKKWDAKNEYGEDDDFVNSAYFPLYKAVETKGFSTSLPEFKELVKYGKTEDEVKSAVTGYFKGQYKDGKATWKEFEKVYKAVNPKADANDLYWVKRECDALIAHKKDKDYKYTKYDSLRSSIESGNRANMKSAVTELTGHGVKAETVAGQITDHFKPILVDMKAKGKPIANLQSYILDCYEMLGYNRAKKLKDIQKWFEPKKEKK